MKRLIQELTNASNTDKENILEQIYNKYGKLFYNIVYDISKNHDFSLETINDIILYIWNNHKKLDNLTNPLAYVNMMLYNKAIDYYRKNKRRIVDFIDEKHIDILSEKEDEIRKIENKLIVDEMLSRLNEDERNVIILKYAYEQSLNEISNTLQISIKKVRLRLEKANKKIMLIKESSKKGDK